MDQPCSQKSLETIPTNITPSRYLASPTPYHENLSEGLGHSSNPLPLLWSLIIPGASSSGPSGVLHLLALGIYECKVLPLWQLSLHLILLSITMAQHVLTWPAAEVMG